MERQPMNVLVVEDDAADYKSVERALTSREGNTYRLARAESMESGKRMLEARDFDAVVLDLGLPDAEGVDSVIAITASSPATPIVVVSGHGNLGTALGVVGLGAEDFLPKRSLSGRLLEEKICVAVERHQNRLRAMEQVLATNQAQTGTGTAAGPVSPGERAKFLKAMDSGAMDVVAQPVEAFGAGEPMALRLQFALNPRAGNAYEKDVSMAKACGCLDRLCLARLKRALEFGERMPGSRLHLDLEIEAMHPAFIQKMLDLMPDPDERSRICFFLPARFEAGLREQAFKSTASLIQAGVDLGIRDAGGGGTVVENMMLLSPSWIRMSPLICQGLAEFKVRRDYLRLWVRLLGGLHAPILADQVGHGDFPLLREMGLAGAVLR